MFPTPATELTRILIIANPARSRAWYLDVLGATLYGEYGTSVVLSFAGAWLLLVSIDRQAVGNEVCNRRSLITGCTALVHDREAVAFTENATIVVRDCVTQSLPWLRAAGEATLSN